MQVRDVAPPPPVAKIEGQYQETTRHLAYQHDRNSNPTDPLQSQAHVAGQLGSQRPGFNCGCARRRSHSPSCERVTDSFKLNCVFQISYVQPHDGVEPNLHTDISAAVHSKLGGPPKTPQANHALMPAFADRSNLRDDATFTPGDRGRELSTKNLIANN